MELGKLINGTILYKSASMLIDGKWVANPTDEMLMGYGYKEVIASEIPEPQEGYRAQQIIRETETGIYLEWEQVVIEPNEE